MSTIPYPDKKRIRRSSAPCSRLIIALSCADPMRLVNDWSVESIDLDGSVADVTIGRGSEELQQTRVMLRSAEVIMLTIPDVHLSSQHLRLTRKPGDVERWQLHDVGSMNGTWVNGEQVTEATLADNDVIEVGETILLYRAAGRTSGAATQEAHTLANGGPDDPRSGELRTLNPKLSASLATLRQIATSNLAILVSGQTGVGKEVMARAIHRWSGRTGPFVAVNCGAFPPTLIASELFGVEKGAYSGAHKSRPGLIRSAHGGTLLLDEIAELPMSCQVVLLRALQEGQVMPVGGKAPIDVDVRVLAATHQDLQERVKDGLFREDLLARLCGFAVTLPPLRERREDIGLLIAHMLPKYLGERGPTPQFSRRAGAQMFMYHWPENIRELEKTLKAAVVLASCGSGGSGGSGPDDPDGWAPDGWIDLEHLPESIARAKPTPPPKPMTPAALAAANRLRAQYAECDGNVSAIARMRKTSRNHVRRLLQRYGITREN